MIYGNMKTEIGLSGSLVINADSVFGEPRVPSLDVYPGSRHYTACWKDENGHFWLYGGRRASLYLGDTWRFDGTMWAYWGGTNSTDDLPVNGPLKSFSFDYHPGTRDLASVATSGSAAYIVGGSVSGTRYGDVWKFDSSRGWAHWGGTFGLQNPIPGTIKVPSLSNTLGSKQSPIASLDNFNNLWIFGGYGLYNSGSMGMLIIDICT
jgi:hypothetical protein